MPRQANPGASAALGPKHFVNPRPTPQQFARLIGSGGLAWRWEAHGFHYGIAAGKTVVVNGSRAHADGLDGGKKVRVVQIVADADQLASRLEHRGRDAPHEVTRRLARNALFSDLRADHTIFNQGELADAGRQLVDYLVGGIEASSQR